MAEKQKFGIKFPIENNDTETFIDLNDTIIDKKKSEIIHVVLTRKGTKLRDPEFGTDLLSYIFEPSDGMSDEGIKTEVMTAINRYVKNVRFENLQIFVDEENEERKVVSIDFSIVFGKFEQKNNVKVAL